MGDVIDIRTKKKIPPKEARYLDYNGINFLLNQIKEKIDKVDFILCIGRKYNKKRKRHDYLIFENFMLPSTKLDLAETLLENTMAEVLKKADDDE